MHCTRHSDPAAFLALARPWLERDPVVNNIVTVNVQMRLDGPLPGEDPPLLISVAGPDGDLVGVALRTPPRSLLLAGVPAEVGVIVAEYLAGLRDAGLPVADLPGVVGPVGGAEPFARRWSELTGTTGTVDMRQRGFRLDRVTPPVGVPGRFRLATESDLDRCVDWMTAFRAEALPSEPTITRDHVARIVGDGRLALWDDSERPVSMVGRGIEASGIVRIGPVYTPPELRGHGYASACTAEISRRALQSGAVACTLTTDLANPTSNALYQRIGYYPIGDAVSVRFE